MTCTEDRLSNDFVDRFFIPAPGPFRAWLLFDRKTGAGLALAVGAFRPSRKLRKGKLEMGAVEVHPRFQPVLLHYGPEALRWNGKEIVVALGVN